MHPGDGGAPPRSARDSPPRASIVSPNDGGAPSGSARGGTPPSPSLQNLLLLPGAAPHRHSGMAGSTSVAASPRQWPDSARSSARSAPPPSPSPGERASPRRPRGAVRLALTDAGAAAVAARLRDPAQRRRTLLRWSAARFVGVDACGDTHDAPPDWAQRLGASWRTHHDWVAAAPDRPAPPPTAARATVATMWSRTLGFGVELPDCVTRAQLRAGRRAARGHAMLHDGSVAGPGADTLSDLYFGYVEQQAAGGLKRPSSRQLFGSGKFPRRSLCGTDSHPDSPVEAPTAARAGRRRDSAAARLKSWKGDSAQYLQCGWLDGVGVYRRGTVPAALERWATHNGCWAADHVPVSGTVRLEPGGPAPPLRMWVVSVKLDRVTPRPAVLRELLYGSPGNSADGADVIAASFTDLPVHHGSAPALRHLLRRTIAEGRRNGDTTDSPDDFVFNEDDEGLPIKYIPASLLQLTGEGHPRYVSLHVAVRKTSTRGWFGDGGTNAEDTFPEPPHIVCRSHQKNDYAPNFKGHLMQEVLLRDTLHQQQGFFHLCVLALNFDTADVARVEQLRRLERLMRPWHREGRRFALVAFGDFNNRLVAWDELAPHIVTDAEPAPKSARGERRRAEMQSLSESGVTELCRRIADAELRRDLFRGKDSFVFIGQDFDGTEVEPPEACVLARELFHLHIDALPGEVPLPTYKRTPIGELLARHLGFPIRVKDLVTQRELDEGFMRSWEDQSTWEWIDAEVGSTLERDRTMSDPAESPFQSPFQPELNDEFASYFATPAQRRVHSGGRGPPLLSCGWPDGVAVHRHGRGTEAEILHYGVASEVYAGDRVPIRALVRISVTPLPPQ